VSVSKFNIRVALNSGMALLLVPFGSVGQAQSTDGHKRDCSISPSAARVPSCVRPKMRYWLPLGQMDAQAVQRDVARIAAAGFGGLEINSIPADHVLVAAQGYGGAEWFKVIRAAMAQARKDGISIDLAIGPFYPAAVAERDIGNAAARELVFTQSAVASHFDGRLTAPAGAMSAQLVGVSALRLVRRDGSGAVFADDSVIDLTSQVAEGSLRWTPPAPGDWQIVASWARNVGHAITGAADRPSVVVDHFSRDGTAKIIATWQQEILPGLGQNRAVLGDIFEDSLHLQGYSLWTDDLLAEFRRRRGYDLRPYLPMLSIGHLNDFFFSIINRVDRTPRSKPDYDLASGRGTRIRDDYYLTLTELYAERHLAPLRAFFSTQDLKLRAQPSYGQSLEGTAPVAQVDIPETESFQLDDHIEAYRVQAGSAHVLGKRIYSAECCAEQGMAGKTNWQDALRHIYRLFAGGVNQIVFHGYAQTTSSEAGAAAWVPFNGAFSENYATIPAWSEAPAITRALAREQAMLRVGKPVIDLAILRNSFWDTGHAKQVPGFDYWADPGIDAAGLTHDYVSPALLALPQWTPIDGRAAPEGPGYRAIVVMPGQALPVAALKSLAATARAGVPVLIVGELPVPLGLSNDAASIPQVRFLADPGTVSAALAHVGITPTVTLAAPTATLRVTRRVKGGDYIWLYNPSVKDVHEQGMAKAKMVFAINFANGRRLLVGNQTDGIVRWDVTVKAGKSSAFFISR
jgi:alpha-L-rhamnosidase